MAITIQCPNPTCLASASVAESITGRNVRCKKCGTPFRAFATIDGEQSETKRSTPSSTGEPFANLPAEFGRYRVLKKLGQGGMGAVYLAEDTQLGRKVALKLPSFDANDAPRRIARFVREARASAVLQHPNICTIYDAGEINQKPFMSMAYIEGSVLEDLIDAKNPLDQLRAAELIRKIALGLEHAHAAGIVHRDLKPANVMLRRNDEPVIMDFGLAKRLADSDSNESRLTHDGAIMGTPSYMSPEQVRGETDQIGPSTDVYSLGVMLFELLTGTTPYGGPMGVVMAQILNSPVPSARAIRPDLDPRLDDLCQQSMAKNPSQRPQGMAIVADRLANIIKFPMNAGPAASPKTAKSATLPVATPFTNIQESIEPVSTGAAQRNTPFPKRKKIPTLWLAVGGAFIATVVVIAIIAFALVGRMRAEGELTIQLQNGEQGLVVKIDDRLIEAQALSGPIRLSPGVHRISVSGDDIEDHASTIMINSKQSQTLPIETKRKAKIPIIPPPQTPGGKSTIAQPPKVRTPEKLMPGEEREFEIYAGVKMRFCWIPPGEATLGSPRDEPERFFDEDEHKYVAKGFWLGKYEVMQSEWEKIMENNPSTSKSQRSPVEQVSWIDCQAFVAKCRVPGMNLQLPHEDDWEYACRGGKGNRNPFYWGDMLGGNWANCDGQFPYGTNTKGPSRKTTSIVGEYEKIAPHPWGLCDMHGNVSEWCSNTWNSIGSRTRRGGSWLSNAANCRSAFRAGSGDATRFDNIGFRIMMEPNGSAMSDIAPLPNDFRSLFNGKDLTGWLDKAGGAPRANSTSGYIELMPAGGDLKTLADFGPDIHFRTEFWLPLETNKAGQARANSGIFLLERYEIQILDSEGVQMDPKLACGALYGLVGPSKDAAKPPECWQTLDVTLHAPIANNTGELVRKGEITVVLNGEKVIDRVEFDETTKGALKSDLSDRGRIIIQSHGSPVRFRNLEIREIAALSK